MLVLVDAFPVMSQTFVVDHVLGLIRYGVRVTLVARQVDRRRVVELQLPADRLEVLQVPRGSLRALARMFGALSANPKYGLSWLLIRCAWHAARLGGLSVVDGPWDAVHAHFANNGVVALLACSRWKPRLLVNFHGHDATVLPQRYGWWPIRLVLGNSRAIVHSDFLAKRVLAGTAMRVHHVTMGVDVQRFRSSERREVWPRPLRLLFVGRLVPQKGAAVALAALAQFRERYPEYDARLTLVGEGPEKFRLERLIVALNLVHAVDGPKPVANERMGDVMTDSDVLLMPSQVGRDAWQEAFGRVAIEAMACGIPVIGCPSGGLADTVGAGGTIASGFDGLAVCDALCLALDMASPEEWRRVTREQVARHGHEKMELDYFNLLMMIQVEGHSF